MTNLESRSLTLGNTALQLKEYLSDGTLPPRVRSVLEREFIYVLVQQVQLNNVLNTAGSIFKPIEEGCNFYQTINDWMMMGKLSLVMGLIAANSSAIEMARIYYRLAIKHFSVCTNNRSAMPFKMLATINLESLNSTNT